MTQLSRGKSLSICKQIMDRSMCQDVLVTLRRNQSICSITALRTLSPHKGPLEAVGFGVVALSVARRNLPTSLENKLQTPHPVHISPILMYFPIFAKPVLKRPPDMDIPQDPQTTHSSESLIITVRNGV